MLTKVLGCCASISPLKSICDSACLCSLSLFLFLFLSCFYFLFIFCSYLFIIHRKKKRKKRKEKWGNQSMKITANILIKQQSQIDNWQLTTQLLSLSLSLFPYFLPSILFSFIFLRRVHVVVTGGGKWQVATSHSFSVFPQRSD